MPERAAQRARKWLRRTTFFLPGAEVTQGGVASESSDRAERKTRATDSEFFYEGFFRAGKTYLLAIITIGVLQ